MNDFYELETDRFYHLREYHEYLFWKQNDRRRGLILRQQEYEDFDIRLLPFEGSEQLRIDAEVERQRMTYPDQMYFTGNFETLEETDYPIVDGCQLPIVSKKFLSTLESVKPFAYKSIPVTIFDFLAEDPFLPNGALRDDVKQTADYVYLKLFQFVMLEDPRSRSNDCIKINEPAEGIDPIFRIRQLPQRLFIAKEARQAIDQFNLHAKEKENRIKGFRLHSTSTRSCEYIDYWGGDVYYKEDDDE